MIGGTIDEVGVGRDDMDDAVVQRVRRIAGIGEGVQERSGAPGKIQERSGALFFDYSSTGSGIAA